MEPVATRTGRAQREGALVTIVINDQEQTLDEAVANMAACVKLAGGVRRPLLVDMRAARPLQPEVRHFYSGESLVSSFTAIAMVISTAPLGRMMGNVYIRVARPGIPTRLFAEREKAVSWLEGHVQR